jgi:TfoX/Sxy family transcriptional regulator of competence genes
MAQNEKLNSRLRTALAHLPDVAEKKMFRGTTFMVNGKMCISAGDSKIMCRIDPSLHDSVVKQAGVSTVIMKGREYKGFVYVTEDAIQTKKQLDYWIKLSLEFNKVAKASEKKKKS